MLIKNISVFNGKNLIPNQSVIIKNGKISEIFNTLDSIEDYEGEIIDGTNQLLAPGYIDLQLNGCGGVLFNSELSFETLKVMHQTNIKFGCTSYLPTLITSPDEKIIKAIEIVKENKKLNQENGILGLHLEGPNISKIKKGVHNIDYVRQLETSIIDYLLDNQEYIKILTMAPETVEIETLEKLNNSKINLSIGHSNATYAECVEKGKYFKHATHLFNAMSPLDSREPGVVGYLLTHSNQYAGIIADGHHLTFSNLELAKKAMNDKLFVVTDAVSPAGTNMKSFVFEGETVYHENGICKTKEGTLGGAAITMDVSVQNLVKKCNLGLITALKMSSTIPAIAIQEDHHLGYIKKDYTADLIILDPTSLEVLKTIKNGKVVFEK